MQSSYSFELLRLTSCFVAGCGEEVGLGGVDCLTECACVRERAKEGESDSLNHMI